MRRAFSDRTERARRPSTLRGDGFGHFDLRTNAGVAIFVVLSGGSDEIPWEHASASSRARCPTWEEMHWIKSLFWEPHEVVMQLHPAEREYVNVHPFCLHLWRPKLIEIPTPPIIAV